MARQAACKNAEKAVLFRIYLAGIKGWMAPRWIRRLLGKTEFHRAWLVGYLAFFEQDGIKYGPANRYGVFKD